MHVTCLGSGGRVCGEGEATSPCWKQNLFSSVSISSPMTLHLLLKRIQISWIKRPAYCWNKQVIHVMGWTLPTSAGYLQCQQCECRLFSMCFAPHLQSYRPVMVSGQMFFFPLSGVLSCSVKSNSFISSQISFLEQGLVKWRCRGFGFFLYCDIFNSLNSFWRFKSKEFLFPVSLKLMPRLSEK